MRFNNILTALAAIALVVAPSCSDDDDVRTPLAATVGNSGDATYNSLTFKWDKVAGATQYGYELTDNEGELVVKDVTKENTVKFSNLKSSTEYSLKVWSYAAFGSDYSTSDPIVLKGTTKSIIKLEAPELKFSDLNIEYQVTWDAVDGAETYNYTLAGEDGLVDSGSVSACSLTFSSLSNGSYTVTVTAASSSDEYIDSDSASLEFTVNVVESWRVSGTYTSAVLGESWNAVLVAYSNNTYKLLGWYGVQGYDLDFYIDADNTEDSFMITGDYDFKSDSYCYKVPTGRTDKKSVYVYPWYNYCGLEGDQNGGDIYICAYSSGEYVYDEFVWTDGASSTPVADDFVGTWNIEIAGQTAITNDWSWSDFSYSYTIDITKVDDNTISMEALYFGGNNINLRIDMENKTLTVEPTTVWEYYTFAGAEGPKTPYVGKINDDGTIELNNYCGWYENELYVKDTTAKLWR